MDGYRELHVFPTQQPRDIRFYSCALARSFKLTEQTAADSILNQALHGFDFTTTIQQAYRDGVRIFLEMGPNFSCTRMIDSILQDKPHLALSACVRGEDDYTTIVKVIAAFIAERVPVDLDGLYGNSAYPPAMIEPADISSLNRIKVMVGGHALSPTLPSGEDRRQRAEGREQRTEGFEVGSRKSASGPEGSRNTGESRRTSEVSSIEYRASGI
jgi:hypothetical protein